MELKAGDLASGLQNPRGTEVAAHCECDCVAVTPGLNCLGRMRFGNLAEVRRSTLKVGHCRSGSRVVDGQVAPVFLQPQKFVPSPSKDLDGQGLQKLGRNRDKQVGSIRWATFFGGCSHPPNPRNQFDISDELQSSRPRNFPDNQLILPGQLRGWAVGRANMCDDSS